jgi:hypothetical protein
MTDERPRAVYRPPLWLWVVTVGFWAWVLFG